MRLWSIHPKYLDSKGLVALWREGLLAKKVLEGRTRGYKNHPQLDRFKSRRKPSKDINAYLTGVFREAESRGYCFNAAKIRHIRNRIKIPVTRGQVLFEIAHLKKKLKKRDKTTFVKIRNLKNPKVNSAFVLSAGGVERWEKLQVKRWKPERVFTKP